MLELSLLAVGFMLVLLDHVLTIRKMEKYYKSLKNKTRSGESDIRE